MNLFELFVKVGVDDQASEKLADMSSKLGNGLKTAAKVGLAAVTAAATGVAALATSAIKNFAEYEQLVGGSELMFGKAFDTVKKNAEEAYKTVQMSQNEYLQQVNGFATGLKTALNGNEQAAADLAHRIIKAEADIIAATGNTAENVQNAFNGIMKSNFTMLDNLQIGITPTKEGFQEVIDKVNEWNAANGKATKYQMDNLADMQSALVDYIEMVGMSGYAQNEAAGTIQGSLAMTKAAWSNLLTGVADDTADFDALIDNLIESVGAFGDNIMPRVEQALDGVVKLIDGLLPKIAEGIPKFIANYAPKLIQAGANILKSLVKGIKNNAKTMVNAAKDIVIELIDELPDLIPEVIDAGVELLSGIVEAIPEVAVKVAKAVPKITEAIVNGLLSATVEVGKAIVGLFVPIEDESEAALERMRANFENITPFADIVNEYARKTVDLSNALSESGRTTAEIESDIAEAEASITAILKSAFDSQQGLRQTDLDNIQKYNDEIRRLNDEKLGIYRDQQLAEFRKLQLSVSEMDVQGLGESIGLAKSALEQSNKVAEEIYAARLVTIENFHKASGTVGSAAYNRELKEAKKHYDSMVAENNKYYKQTVDIASKRASELGDNIISEYEDFTADFQVLAKKLQELADAGYAVDSWASVADSLGLTDSTVAEYTDRLNKLDTETANAFLSMQATVIETGGTIDEETQKTIEAILSAYKPLPGELGEVGTEALRQMVKGLENQIPRLKNASNMSAEAIIETLNDYFATNAPTSGETFVQELSQGIVDAGGKLVTISKNLGAEAAGAFNSSYSSYIAIPSASGGPGGRLMLPQHANGLTYVPYDGYVAELHKGERVLTATQARNYGGATIGNVTINIDGANYGDEETLAMVIAEKIQNMTERRAAVYA